MPARARPAPRKNIPAAQDDSDLDSHLGQVADLARDALEDDRIDAVILAAEQCLRRTILTKILR